MRLRKLCLLAVLATVGTLAFAPSALAWTFSASGSATCDTAAGQHVITWTLDNRSEPETLTIRKSDRAAVPVGSTVARNATGQFTERLAGTTTGTVTLNVEGNWPSDRTNRVRSATVTLPTGCKPPVDVCPNIDGAQATVPAGLVKDAQGNCVPIDVCPNIDGAQATVPAGLVKDAQGNCVTDVCPNIDGIQLTLPSGLVKDALGKCVPVDVCPNLDGAQATVPSGLVKDAQGNCVPVDVCANIEGIQTATPTGWMNHDGQCHCPPETITVTQERIIEKTVTVPQIVEKLVTLQASPRVITKVIIKKVKIKPKKKKVPTKVKGVRHGERKPGVLPFTR